MILPSRSSRTPFTGPLTTLTCGAIFSIPSAACTMAAQAKRLLTQPSLICLQHSLPLIGVYARRGFLVFGMVAEDHLHGSVQTPRRKLGDPLDGSCGRRLDQGPGFAVRDAHTRPFAGEA